MTAAIDKLVVETLLTHGGLNYLTASTDISLNGNLSLTVNSVCLQYLTGNASGFSVVLPDASTLVSGHCFIIANTTSSIVNVKDGSGSVLFQLSQNSVGYLYLQTDTTVAGYWLFYQVLASSTASGIIHYKVNSSTPFTTSSSTDTPITSFAVTPQAGTYAIWYNSDNIASQNNATVTQTIYKNGSAIIDSLRRTQSVSSNFIFQQTSMTVDQFNGTDICDLRIKTNQGSVTVAGRSLILIRLGT